MLFVNLYEEYRMKRSVFNKVFVEAITPFDKFGVK